MLLYIAKWFLLYWRLNQKEKMKNMIYKAINEIYNMLDELNVENDADYDLIKDIKINLDFLEKEIGKLEGNN